MDKRERLIQGALAAFQANGIEKTKISDIVQHAGVAQGTFYLYFPSKLAIMPAIAEVMADKLVSALKTGVNEQAPFTTQLEQLVEAVFTLTHEYSDIQALVYAGLASTDYLSDWEAVYEPVYQWLSSFLEKAVTAGAIRASIQPYPTAKLVIGLIESAAEQVYLYDRKQEQPRHDQQAEVIIFLKHALGVV